MKTNLQVKGRVELSHQEVSMLIMTHLAEKHSYKVTKVVYETDNALTNRLNGVVCEIEGLVEQQEQDIATYRIKEKEKRASPDHPVIKRNMGVYDNIRWLLNLAFRNAQKAEKSVAEVPFDILLNDIVELHPGMDEIKLSTYLYDTRQLGTNVEWKARDRKILVRAIINHIP